MHLKLTTDRKFALSDENYLFECMGLNRTNEGELRQMFPAKIIEYLNHEQILASLPRDIPKPPAFDMHMLDSIEAGTNSNGRKDEYGDNLLCKDERFNSLTSSTGKNSNHYTQSSAVRNPNSTPITKLCGQRVLQDAFYSQTPQHLTSISKIGQSIGAKVHNISHPFMNSIVSQDEMNSQTTLTEEAQHRY